MGDNNGDGKTVLEKGAERNSVEKSSKPSADSAAKAVKHGPGAKDAKQRKESKPGKSFSAKWKDLKGEFNKIIWPGKKELAKQTATVVMTSAIVGGIIVVFDTLYALGLTTFSSFISR